MSANDPDTLIHWPEPLPREVESDDAAFYSLSRFVEHIDDGAIQAVTSLYRELLPVDGRVLDVMSSWISRLPEEGSYAGVVSVGMNATELAKNPPLDRYLALDLNKEVVLPFASGSPPRHGENVW